MLLFPGWRCTCVIRFKNQFKNVYFFIYGFYGNMIVSKLAYGIYMSSQFYFFFILLYANTSSRIYLFFKNAILP